MFKHLCLALLFAAFTLPAQAADYTDIWYTPPEDGWGVNFVQSDSFIFATFFVYGPDNKPIWYTGEMIADGLGHYTGGLYLTTGTYFGTVPYDPAQKGITQVGTLTFTPTAADTGVLTYNVGAVVVTKNIQRLTLTGIALGGNYVGGQTGTYASCTDSTANGSYYDTYTLSVTQSVGVATFTFTYDKEVATCTMSGALEQHGQLYRIPNASYQCTGDLTIDSNADMFEIKATAQGIEARFAGSPGGGCQETAQFSAVLF
jgi:hypothetical protein